MTYRFKFIVVLAGFILMQCTNPFATRSPEPPLAGDNSISFGVQTTPDSTLAKLQRSFRSDGANAYTECFADTFTFVAEQDEADRLANWDVNSESRYFTTFIRTDTLQGAQLDYNSGDVGFEISQDPFTPNRVRVEFNYQIEAEFNQSIKRFQGRSVLTMSKSPASELWFVGSWQDFKLTGGQLEGTWSTLRAIYQ